MSDHEAVSGAVQAARPPSVDALARSLEDAGLPHPLLVDIAREAIAAGDPGSARERAVALSRALLQPVINATGVLLHTNLGRAPLGVTRPPSAWNLELGLDTGERGSRQAHCGRLLARLCGAERALVVNNNASAVLLVLAALARGREVLVSRGESVEIGGGFRVPEVMEQSGARLVDVGTTNRTRIADYDRALTRPGADVALILKVHPSNYRVEGFVEDTSVAALAGLAAGQDGPLVVADIGSGLLDAGCPWLPGGPPAWLVGEPAARQTLAAGAALVTFSGDKLLGGPQAGVIAGRAGPGGDLRVPSAGPCAPPRWSRAQRLAGCPAGVSAARCRRGGAVLADGRPPCQRPSAASGGRRAARGRDGGTDGIASRRRFAPGHDHPVLRSRRGWRPLGGAAPRRPSDHRQGP